MAGQVRPFLIGAASGSVVTAIAVTRAVPAVVDRLRARGATRVGVARPALIVNRWSGGGKADRSGLVDRARELGVSVTVLERGQDLRVLARRALDAGADAIGMAGGDGSLGLVAEVAMERDVPFFCIPVGTRNHFALDLGLKRDDPLWSLRALSNGDELRVDVGEATAAGQPGRLFLNNVSFGIYAMAVQRPEYRDDKARTLAAVVGELAADPSAVPSLRFVAGDGASYDRASVLLVSNNQYTWSGPPDFGRRVRLDGGELGALAMAAIPSGVAADEVTTAQAVGRSEWTAPSLTIDSDDAVIVAGLDGESVQFAAPLQLRSIPRGLRVLVPAGTLPGYLRPAEAFAARLLDLADLTGSDEGETGPTGDGTDDPGSEQPSSGEPAAGSA
jgi:diacylglycerol kinase family enzyme